MNRVVLKSIYAESHNLLLSQSASKQLFIVELLILTCVLFGRFLHHFNQCADVVLSENNVKRLVDTCLVGLNVNAVEIKPLSHLDLCVFNLVNEESGKLEQPLAYYALVVQLGTVHKFSL